MHLVTVDQSVPPEISRPDPARLIAGDPVFTT